MAEEGGLIGYGPRLTLIYRQTARLVAKVMGGAKPEDLPVEQATKFELVINLKTATAMGRYGARDIAGPLCWCAPTRSSNDEIYLLRCVSLLLAPNRRRAISAI
jgi:hypothetical protein